MTQAETAALRAALAPAFRPVPAAAARALWSCDDAAFARAARPDPAWWGRGAGGYFGTAYAAIAARFPAADGAGEEARTRREIAAVLRIARAHFGGRAPRVLDVPCGSGRHARALAAEGLDVVGLDLQEGPLAALRPLPVAVADMRALPLAPAGFDLVLNLWNSLGYFLEEAEDLAALREFRRVLRPGGLALVQSDLDERAVAAGRWVQHMKVPLGDGALFLQRQVPVAALGGLVSLSWVMIPGEEPWQGPAWFLRLRDEADWRRIAAAAGFREAIVTRSAPGATPHETLVQLLA